MLIKDGGGGGGTPQVTSDVTVDPGEIRAFARFLAEMHEDLKGLRDSVGQLTDIDRASFGAYDTSSGAFNRSSTTIADEREFLTTVLQRMNQLTTDTSELARDYADLDALNQVAAGTVTQQLNADTTA